MINKCICQYVVVASQLSKSQPLLLGQGIRWRVLSGSTHVAGVLKQTSQCSFLSDKKMTQSPRGRSEKSGLRRAYVAGAGS